MVAVLMFGVWQTGLQFQHGQPPWYVSSSWSRLESWADRNIQRNGRNKLFFAESRGSEQVWRDEDLRCIGHSYEDETKMRAREKQQEQYIATRKSAIRNGCRKLTDDERARPTVNLDTDTEELVLRTCEGLNLPPIA